MIVLRQESFGAIAFNPENATELWLDQGFFNLFKNDPKDKKLEEVYKKLDCKNKSFEIIKKINTKTEYPFPVLSGPTLADVNITNKCNLNCPHCYMSSNKYGNEMKLEDYLLVLDECKKMGCYKLPLVVVSQQYTIVLAKY